MFGSLLPRQIQVRDVGGLDIANQDFVIALSLDFSMLSRSKFCCQKFDE